MADAPKTRAQQFADAKRLQVLLKAWKANGSKGPRPTLASLGSAPSSKPARGGMQKVAGRKAIIGKKQGKQLSREELRRKRIGGSPKRRFNAGDLA